MNPVTITTWPPENGAAAAAAWSSTSGTALTFTPGFYDIQCRASTGLDPALMAPWLLLTAVLMLAMCGITHVVTSKLAQRKERIAWLERECDLVDDDGDDPDPGEERSVVSLVKDAA